MRFVKATLVHILVFGLAFLPSLQLQAETLRDETSKESLVFANENHELDELVSNETYGRHRLDSFRLLQQEHFAYINYRKNGDVRRRNEWIKRDQLKTVSLSEKSGNFFEIQFQGQTLLRFHIPIRSVFVFGDYLVFQDQDSFNSKTGFHYLGFIDLKKFEKNLGRSRLPIFHLPVKTDQETSQLRFVDDQMYVGEEKVGDEQLSSSEVLREVSNIHEMALHISAGLVDSSTFESSRYLIEDLHQSIKRFTKLSESIEEGSLRTQSELREFIHNQLSHKADYRKNQNESQISFLKEGPIQQALDDVLETRATQRKINARFKVLLGRLAAPKEKAVDTILGALATVAVKLGHQKNNLPSLDPEEQQRSRLLRYARWGIPITAGFLLAQVYPTETAEYMHQSLSMTDHLLTSTFGSVWESAKDQGSGLISFIWEKASAVGETAKIAAQRSMGFVDPQALQNQYVSNDRWWKTLVGLGTAFSLLGVTVGLPHFLINAKILIKDLKTNWREEEQRDEQEQKGVFKSTFGFPFKLKQKFIERQNQEELTYLKQLIHETGEIFSEEEESEILEKIETEWEQNKSIFQRLGILRAGNPKPIQGLMRAIFHFLGSASSFTHSGFFYAKTWNQWYVPRAFVWKPSVWLPMLYYPNYFKTILGPRAEDGTLPSVWNGGLRPFYKEYPRRVLSLFDNSEAKRLKEWEETVLLAEKKIHKAVIHHAHSALVQFAETEEEAMSLFENRGMKNLTDPKLENLPHRLRHYFRLYYSFLFEESVKDWMKTSFHKTEAWESLHDEPTDLKIKNLAFQSGEDLDLTEGEATLLVERVAAQNDIAKKAINKVGVLQTLPSRIAAGIAKAEPLVKSLSFGTAGVDFEGLLSYPHLRAFNILDIRKNAQVKRVKTVNKQIENPHAMARAVRAVRASLIIDKPLELIQLFLMLAAVTVGLNVPIHDQMFSEDSWFYLGRYPFLTVFTVGITMSVMSEIWYKLQIDELHEGHFDDIPREEDAKKSFWTWYRNKLFQKSDNPAHDNSWWNNHKHMLSIVWANMPAAIANYLLIYPLTMGRFEIDNFVVAYLLLYSTPFEGMGSKIEQGFEMATHYHAKSFTEKELKHPTTQQFLNTRVQHSRYAFNFFYKLLYENPLGFFLQNWQTLGTVTYGPRSLSRILFNNFMLAEWAAQGFETFEDRLGWVPGVRPCSEALHHLFLNNNVDAVRTPEITGGMPPGVHKFPVEWAPSSP